MIELMHGLDADLDDLSQYVGWWWQEKYRGVRLFWDGSEAWSRQGGVIRLPADWYEAMPKIALDCELYDGVDGERRCASVVRHGAKHVTKSMRILAFDSPGTDYMQGFGFHWEFRNELARRAIETSDFDRIEHAPWGEIESVEQMLELLQAVHDRKGEGLILRKPRSQYVAGYSDNIIKLKHAA